MTLRRSVTKTACVSCNALALAGALLIGIAVWAVSAGDARAAAKPKVPPQLAAMISSAVDNSILPAFDSFEHASQSGLEKLKAWCESPSPATLDEARRAFGESVHSWARIEYVRFGPARTNNRWQRIAFLPDPRGVARRQVARALADRKPDLLAVDAIAKQSAALQGLPALEILLFSIPDAEASEVTQYRCKLAVAVSAYVAAQAHEMRQEWTGPDGWREKLLKAGPDNSDYKSANEAAAELLRTLLTGLQIVRDEMLLPWLKAAQECKAWAGMPFELSGHARDVVTTSLISLRGLHKALHLDLVVHIISTKSKDKAWIDRWVPAAYSALESDLKTIALPSKEGTEALASEDNLKVLRRARVNTSGLRQIIGREIAPAAALTIGFNELDGD